MWIATIWEFVKQHLVIVFLKAVRNYLIGGVAKKVGRKIKEIFFGKEEEYYCTSCEGRFTYDFLYDGYWFSSGRCPDCGGLGTIRKEFHQKEKAYLLDSQISYA